MYSQSRAQRPVGAFCGDRALRILPLYWLLTAAFAALLLALPNLVCGPARSRSGARCCPGMVNWLILREWLILFVGWSLEYEALFYLLFALASLTVPLRRVPWLLAGALAVTVWLGWLEDMVLEFAAGMLIARLRIARDHLPGQGDFRPGVVGFVLPVLGTPVAPRALYLGIPSGMIVLGAVFLPQVKSRFGEYLGAASIPSIWGGLCAARRLSRGARACAGAGYDLKVLAMGAIAITLGCLLYSVIELPMTRWLLGQGRGRGFAPA